jgi:hypothetical protein
LIAVSITERRIANSFCKDFLIIKVDLEDTNSSRLVVACPRGSYGGKIPTQGGRDSFQEEHQVRQKLLFLAVTIPIPQEIQAQVWQHKP